ncbi:MAG: RNA polymerase-binding protein DksA [Proteobacteria bacterium]|nr:RNA polymerase-binding protein DksA [Pseudomonadota bacterium]
MPAKKTASKNRKQVATSRKKVARKRNVSRKKVAARKKRPVARKKIAKKKVSKKKVSARKNKVSKKRPVTRKKIAKKKVSKKRPVTRKKIAKKKVSKKRPVTRKKIAKKKVSKKKAVSRRGPPARKTSVQRTRSRGDLLSGPIHGISPYKPRRGEEYMSTGQQQYFSEILGAWKGELMFEVDRTVHHMQDEAANFPDPNDRATQESEFGLELRTRDRERKLLRKIDSALSRIDEGSYGFCDETGEEIGLKRLEARPVATLCLEAQERRELAERQFRDRDDRYR